MDAHTSTAFTMLFAIFLLWIAAVIVAIVARIGQSGGIGEFLGSDRYKVPRIDQSTLSSFSKRANAVVGNIQEQYAFFLAAVLSNIAVNGAQGGTEALALWSTVFVGARVAHAVVYWVGITLLRTAAWAVGVVATVMLFLQLL